MSGLTFGVSRVLGGLFGAAVVNGVDFRVGRGFLGVEFGARVDFGVNGVVWGLGLDWSGFLLVGKGLLGTVGFGAGNGFRMAFCFLFGLVGLGPVDVFFVGLGFGTDVGFFTGLEGFNGVGLGPIAFEPSLEEAGRAAVGFGPKDLVTLIFGDVFPGVGFGPTGFVGVSQTAGFEAVGLGVLRLGLGVTKFKDNGESIPVCIKERGGGVVEEGLGRTPSLILTEEDPPAPFTGAKRKLVGVKVKVRLGGKVWANSGGACRDGRGRRAGGAGL